MGHNTCCLMHESYVGKHHHPLTVGILLLLVSLQMWSFPPVLVPTSPALGESRSQIPCTVKVVPLAWASAQPSSVFPELETRIIPSHPLSPMLPPLLTLFVIQYTPFSWRLTHLAVFGLEIKAPGISCSLQLLQV